MEHARPNMVRDHFLFSLPATCCLPACDHIRFSYQRNMFPCELRASQTANRCRVIHGVACSERNSLILESSVEFGMIAGILQISFACQVRRPRSDAKWVYEGRNREYPLDPRTPCIEDNATASVSIHSCQYLRFNLSAAVSMLPVSTDRRVPSSERVDIGHRGSATFEPSNRPISSYRSPLSPDQPALCVTCYRWSCNRSHLSICL